MNDRESTPLMAVSLPALRPLNKEVGIQVACLVCHGWYTLVAVKSLRPQEHTKWGHLAVSPVNVAALRHHGIRLYKALVGEPLPPGV